MSLFRQTTGVGPDLVLLHGWGLNGALFDGLTPALAGRFRVHALDLPGHGRSPQVGGAGDLEGLARRVAEHLPESCAVLGWSLGGMLATRIAALFPARVRALVCVATTPRFLNARDWAHGVDEAVLADLARAVRKDPLAAVRDFLSFELRGDERPLETLRELKRALLAHPPPTRAALLAGIEMLRATDLRRELARVVAPTLVVGGLLDRLTPPTAATALAEGIEGARLERVAGAGHVPFVSHATLVGDLVAAFLESPR